MSGSMFALRPEAREFKPSGVDLTAPTNPSEMQNNLPTNLLGYQCLNEKNVVSMSPLKIPVGHNVTLNEEKNKTFYLQRGEHVSSPVSLTSTRAPKTYVSGEACGTPNGVYENKVDTFGFDNSRPDVEDKGCWASLNPNAPPFVPTADPPFLYEGARFCDSGTLLHSHGVSSLAKGNSATSLIHHPPAITSAAPKALNRNATQTSSIHGAAVAYGNPLPRSDETLVSATDKSFHAEPTGCASAPYISSPLQYHYMKLGTPVHPIIDKTSFSHPQFCAVRNGSNATVLDQGCNRPVYGCVAALSAPLPVATKMSDMSTISSSVNVPGDLCVDTEIITTVVENHATLPQRVSLSGAQPQPVATHYVDATQTKAPAGPFVEYNKTEKLDATSVKIHNSSQQVRAAHSSTSKPKYSSKQFTPPKQVRTENSLESAPETVLTSEPNLIQKTVEGNDQVNTANLGHSKTSNPELESHTQLHEPVELSKQGTKDSDFSRQPFKSGRRYHASAASYSSRRHGGNYNNAANSHQRYDSRRYPLQYQKSNGRNEKTFSREKKDCGPNQKSMNPSINKTEKKVKVMQEKPQSSVQVFSSPEEKAPETRVALCDSTDKAKQDAVSSTPNESAKTSKGTSWAELVRQAAPRVSQTPAPPPQLGMPNSKTMQAACAPKNVTRQGEKDQKNLSFFQSRQSSASNKGATHGASNRRKSNRETRDILPNEQLEEKENLSQYSAGPKHRHFNANNRVESKVRGGYNKRTPDFSAKNKQRSTANPLPLHDKQRIPQVPVLAVTKQSNSTGVEGIQERVALQEEKASKQVSWASIAKGPPVSEVFVSISGVDAPPKSLSLVEPEATSISNSASIKRKIENAPLSTPIQLFDTSYDSKIIESNMESKPFVDNVGASQAIQASPLKMPTRVEEKDCFAQGYGNSFSSDVSVCPEVEQLQNVFAPTASGVPRRQASHRYASYGAVAHQEQMGGDGSSRVTELVTRHREGVRLQNAPMPIVVLPTMLEAQEEYNSVNGEVITDKKTVTEDINDSTSTLLKPESKESVSSPDTFKTKSNVSHILPKTTYLLDISIQDKVLDESHALPAKTLETQLGETFKGTEAENTTFKQTGQVLLLGKQMFDEMKAEDIPYVYNAPVLAESMMFSVELEEISHIKKPDIDPIISFPSSDLSVHQACLELTVAENETQLEPRSTVVTHQEPAITVKCPLLSNLTDESESVLENKSELEDSTEEPLHITQEFALHHRLLGKRELSHNVDDSPVKKRSALANHKIFFMEAEELKEKSPELNLQPTEVQEGAKVNTLDDAETQKVKELFESGVTDSSGPDARETLEETKLILAAPESRVYPISLMLTVQKIMQNDLSLSSDVSNVKQDSFEPWSYDSGNDVDRKSSNKFSMSQKQDTGECRESIAKHFPTTHEGQQDKAISGICFAKDTTWRGASHSNASNGASPQSMSLHSMGLTCSRSNTTARSNFLTNRHQSMESQTCSSPEKDSEATWRISVVPRKTVENSRLTIAKSITDHGEKIHRNLRALLNKLTLEKFDTLYEKIKDCGMVDSEDIKRLMQLICSKAKTQHHYIPMYVRLCLQLHRDIPTMNVKMNGENEFRRLLVDACQASFEETLKPIVAPIEMNDEDAFEYILFEKKKMKGNMIFVGELAKAKMIAGKVLYNCINYLLSNKGEPQLEALCVLLHTAGHYLDSGKFKESFEDQMEIVNNLAHDPKVSKRLRCLLQDVLDDYKNGWEKSKKEPDGPRKLDDLRKELEIESRQRSNACSKQDYNSLNSSGGMRYNRHASDDEFQTVGGRRGNLRGSRPMGSGTQDISRATTGSYSPYLVNSRDVCTSSGTGRQMGNNKNSFTGSTNITSSGGGITNHTNARVVPKRSHIGKDQAQKDIGRPVMSFFETGKNDMGRPFYESFNHIPGTPSESLVGNLRQLSSIQVAGSVNSDLMSSPDRNLDCLKAFNQEEAREKVESCASRFSSNDPDSFEESLTTLHAYLKSHRVTNEDISYLVGTAVLLVVEARVSRQSILRDWLLEWRKRHFISQSAFDLGLKDFVRYRYESTKCDNPDLRSIFETCILRRAEEAKLISTSLFEELFKEIQELEG